MFFLLLTVRLPGCNESYGSIVAIFNRKCAFTNEIAGSVAAMLEKMLSTC